MRSLREFNIYWVESPYGPKGDPIQGAFLIPYPLGGTGLRVIAATGEGWDHVSVSLPDRTPTWAEMEFIKRMFFRDTEVAMQLHVTPEKHINIHPYVLHLWRPHYARIPMPPGGLV
jgi:hypothetical protein